MSLRTSESIAGAVAREIDRINQVQEHYGEGAAYKAAWDRKGSSASKHCDSFKRDAMISECVAIGNCAGMMPGERLQLSQPQHAGGAA